MSSVNVGFSCNETEFKRFQELCKKANLTVGQGIQMMIRQACDKADLPLEYDYECPEHIQKQLVTDDMKKFLIPIDKFISWVEAGEINDYDGVGYLSDGEYEYYNIICDVPWLKDQPKKFTFVLWYNR